MKLKSARRKALDQQPLDLDGLLLRYTVHHSIISVAGERATRHVPPHPPIEGVVHEEIHQHGTHNTTLRRTAITWTNLSGLGYRGRLQPSPNIQQHPLTIRVLAQCLHQQIVIEIVESSFDIKLNHPVMLPAPLTCHSNRILRRPSWPIAIRVRIKMRLQQFHQKTPSRLSVPPGPPRWAPVECGFLHFSSVYLLPSLAVGNSYPRPCGSRSRRDCATNSSRTRDILFINPRSTPIRSLRTSMRRRPGALLIANDFVDVVNSSLIKVGQSHLQNNAAPSLHAHYRRFITTMSCSAPALRFGVRTRGLNQPLAAFPLHRKTGSHVP